MLVKRHDLGSADRNTHDETLGKELASSMLQPVRHQPLHILAECGEFLSRLDIFFSYSYKNSYLLNLAISLNVS